ncbi:AFH_G0023370.mRNA.1.CDS.1 [Saccharomyces cerevisiae]|nr:AFH_G0023370.mRNA.1.CDS.1 [Saccharomyces cerevisiae]CAI6726703.1 AFH_G0023370.mRNA.1.CDS.1 [Saccharomyces cerevisiae]
MSQGANASHLIARGGGNSSTSAFNSRRNSLIRAQTSRGVEEDDDDEDDRLTQPNGKQCYKIQKFNISKIN